MKKINYLLALMIGFAIGSLTMKYDIESITPKVELPEEYKMIDKSTAIQGYFDKDSVLHIEFDNTIQFIWEGLEKDIPDNGIHQLQLRINEIGRASCRERV
jgi:hypothetical protein